MRKIEKNELSQETKSSMATRIITGVIFACICVPAIFFGSWWFFLLILAVTILSAIEISQITDLKGTLKVLISILTVFLVVAIVYYIFYENQLKTPETEKTLEEIIDDYRAPEFLSKSFVNIHISIMLVTLAAAIYFIISFFSHEFTVKYVFYYITMIIVISIGIQSILFLRYSPEATFRSYYAELYPVVEGEPVREELKNALAYIESPAFQWGQSSFLIIYVIIGVIANDIGAYFIGVLFGKHKMNEKISPKKTWEGFLGGCVFSLILSTTFVIVVTYLGKPILPIFDFINGNKYAVYFVLIISIFLPVIADVGDFIFSSIKRYWGVKDFGKILPGHGGILDRIDSLIFSAALVACLITFINLILYPALRVSIGA